MKSNSKYSCFVSLFFIDFFLVDLKNQEKSGFLTIKLSLKIFLCIKKMDRQTIINLEINNLKI